MGIAGNDRRRRPLGFCAFEQSFFCAKTYEMGGPKAKTTIVSERVEVVKLHKTGSKKGVQDGKGKYFKLKIELKMKMRKANMCERIWRHLPYTCSVKKITTPVEVIVKGCEAYDGGAASDNSGPPPKALCDHYKKSFPAAHQMNAKPQAMLDFKGSFSGKWKGFTRPAASIPHVATIEAAAKAFVA